MDRIVSSILSGSIRKVSFLTGAGVSTASGIPDFRSLGGLYDTLRPELITATPYQRQAMIREPTLVVDYELFKVNQFPYLEVRRPFILGTAENKWKATMSHYFMKVLDDKGILTRVYTQNIDGLDYQIGLPDDKIVAVHGSIAKASCEFCQTQYDTTEFREAVRTQIRNIYDPNDQEAPQESTHILCKSCNKPGVKPSTVLYGRNLPNKVYKTVAQDFPSNIDLLVIMGTSLTVYPAASYVQLVSESTSRLVCNYEPVGENVGIHLSQDENTKNRDVWLKGSCDEGILKLVTQLGWLQELAVYKDKMCTTSRTLLENHMSHTSSAMNK